MLSGKTSARACRLMPMAFRFDSLGCTAAAVRLLNHECKEVQLNALRLMLALLQSGNDKVQNNVRQLFVSKSGRGALQRLKSIISGGVELISVNYKRSVKTRKHSEKLVYLSRTYTEPEPPEKTEKHGSGSLPDANSACERLALTVVFAFWARTHVVRAQIAPDARASRGSVADGGPERSAAEPSGQGVWRHLRLRPGMRSPRRCAVHRC